MTGRPSVDLAIRLYPAWWRERYADEVRVVADDLAGDGRSVARITYSLLRGVMRARTTAQGMPRTYALWSTRTRVSIAAATLPWLVVAPIALMAMGTRTLHAGAGSVMYSGVDIGLTHLQIFGAPPRPAPPLTPAGSVIPFVSLAIIVLFLVTLAVLASGWSGLTGAIRRTTVADRRRLWLLAWAPGFALLADIALFVAQTVVRPHSYRSVGGRPFVAVGGHPYAAHVLGTVLGVVAIGGWLVAVACVAVAARRADVAPSDLRFGRSVSFATTTLFALLLTAYLAWGIGLIVQARQSAHGTFTTIAYSHQDLWLPMVVVIALAVVVSGLSSREAGRSWRILSSDIL